MAFLWEPWPWYVAGPLIGLVVPALLLLGNKPFGISSNFRHLCAISGSETCDYFAYDWRSHGSWNLMFLAGIVLGGALAVWLSTGAPIGISDGTRDQLAALGITDFSGFAPSDLFSWRALTRWPVVAALAAGGWLIGFGTAYAGGCTSGHSITGIADLQIASMIATGAFMAGGFASTYLLLPWILGALR
jgi:uncharacterized membrane protein YedE/YeeE